MTREYANQWKPAKERQETLAAIQDIVRNKDEAIVTLGVKGKKLKLMYYLTIQLLEAHRESMDAKTRERANKTIQELRENYLS